MPLTATYTEDLVRGIAPDEATFKQAQEIAGARKFQNLGVSSDGSWLLGECQGSATEPYQMSADFHDPNNPVLRSPRRAGRPRINSAWLCCSLICRIPARSAIANRPKTC